MPTSGIALPIPAPILPDNTGSGNSPAAWEKVVSTGSQPANAPKLTFYQHIFRPSTDDHVIWQFLIPGNWLSGGTLRFAWACRGTSNNIVWKASTKVIVPDVTDSDAAVYNTVVKTAAQGVPGTIGQVKVTTLALDVTDFAINRPLNIFFGRDADDGSDNSSSDGLLIAASFEYTS
jgi:hypothetical protein